MASYYWLKLWIEIVDDAKSATLDDHTWRRFVEFLCLAKERNRKGELPDTKEIAWRLRTTEEDILEALGILKQIKVVTFMAGADRWLVTNFEKRQAKVTPKERMRRSRALHAGDKPVTHRNAEEEEEDSVTKRNTAEEEEEEEEENEGAVDVAQFLKDLHIDAQFDGPSQPFVRTLQTIIDREGPARATALATRAIGTWEKSKKSRYNLTWVNEIVKELHP